MKLHSCTMFCTCPAAQRLAGGAAAERAGTPPERPHESIRAVVARVDREHATTTRRVDPR